MVPRGYRHCTCYLEQLSRRPNRGFRGVFSGKRSDWLNMCVCCQERPALTDRWGRAKLIAVSRRRIPRRLPAVSMQGENPLLRGDVKATCVTLALLRRQR